ncbi:MAG: ATP-binding protein, partial [Nanoarchaeota archaeon]
LRKKYNEIFYYHEKGECDFLIKEKNKITKAIQVCYKINNENEEREVNGLIEALEKFNLKSGLILTYNQEDIINKKGKRILIKPIRKWILE